MAKGNDIDTLIAMSILGSLLDPDVIAKARAAKPPFNFDDLTGQNGEKKPLSKDEILAKGAASAKKIYDSYITAGFNEVQAFELLKLVLTNNRNN